MHYSTSAVLTFAASLAVANHVPGIPDPWVYLCSEEDFAGTCVNTTFTFNECYNYDTPVVAKSVQLNWAASLYYEAGCATTDNVYVSSDEESLGENAGRAVAGWESTAWS